MADQIDLSERSIEQLAQSIGRISGGGSTGRYTGSFSASSSTAWLNNLSSGSTTVLGSFDKLVTGSYKVGDAFGDVAKVSGLFGPLGRAVGDLTTQIGGIAVGINDQLKLVSQSGVYFGNNMGLYVDAVTNARMSLSEFTAITRQNGMALNGLSYGMDRSALTFLSLARGVHEETSGLVYALKATGVGAEEFNQLLLTQVANRKFIDYSDVRSKQEVINSTITLATELDNIARLYGISRQQQQKELERQMAKDEVFLKMSAQTAEQQSQFVDTMAQVNKFGPMLGDIVSEEFTGGIRTREGSARVAAAGEAGSIAIEIGRVLREGTAEERKGLPQLEKQMGEALQRTFADSQKMAEIARLAGAGNETARMMVQMAAEYNRRIGGTETQIREQALRKGMTIDEYKAEIAKDTAAQRLGALTGTGGPEGAAAVPAQVLNRAEAFTKDLSAAAGRGFNSLNNEVGKSIKGFEGLNTVLRPWATADFVTAVEGQITKLRGKAGEILPSKPTEKPADYSVVPEKATAKKPELNDGTLGVFGQLFNNFGKGTEVILHGEEAVIPKNQFAGIINQFSGIMQNTGSRTDGMSSMINQLSSFTGASRLESAIPPQIGNVIESLQLNLKTEIQKVKSSMPTMEGFEKILTQITPQEQPKPAITQSIPFSPNTNNTDAVMSDMAKGIEGLNMRVERLITAVIDGSDKSIRALKSRGNAVA